MKRIIFCMFLIMLGVINNALAGKVPQPQSPDIPVGPDKVFIQGTTKNELKIMSYNVLNLFDADKDADKNDWEWLPKNTPGKQKFCQSLQNYKDQERCRQFDWNYEKVDLKLNQIKKVVDFQGTRPDMMAVVEVENENVLRLLAAKLGYQHYIITNGPDQRGIDVGLMFNTKPGLTYQNWAAIPVSFNTKHRGRDLLRVDFIWNKKPLSIYVNHWPSQFNPTEERVACAQFLAQDIEAMTQANGAEWSALAVGDFNTLDTEQPNAFRDVIHNERWSNYLYDAEIYARQSPNNPSLPYVPPGTYYFMKDDVWNRLDRIIVTKNLIDQKNMEFAQESYRILFPQFMGFNFKRFNNPQQHGFQSPLEGVDLGADVMTLGNKSGDRPPLSPSQPPPSSEDFRYVRIPNRYNFDTNDESKRGYSDHLPVVFKLRYSN